MIPPLGRSPTPTHRTAPASRTISTACTPPRIRACSQLFWRSSGILPPPRTPLRRRTCGLSEVGELIRRLGRPSPRDPTDEIRTDLARELRALPPKQAAAVVLRYMHGFTNREIAHALNVPERTIASRRAAAKSRLR